MKIIKGKDKEKQSDVCGGGFNSLSFSIYCPVLKTLMFAKIQTENIFFSLFFQILVKSLKICLESFNKKAEKYCLKHFNH